MNESAPRKSTISDRPINNESTIQDPGISNVHDSVGFNDKVWIDNQGRPQTERLHVIERFRRLDLGRLELEITIDDPGAYTRPWKVRRLLHLAPNEEIQEYICNENNRTEHFVAH